MFRINKLAIILIIFLMFNLLCFAKPTQEQKQIVKQIYHDEFVKFTDNAYFQQKKINNILLQENDNITILFEQMVNNIQSKAQKQGIKITIKPFFKIRNEYIKQDLKDYYKNAFNPNAAEIPTSTLDYLVDNLMWSGKMHAYTRYHKGDINKSYFEKIYIVTTYLDVKSGFFNLFTALDDKIEYRYITVSQPYSAQNKHLKLAEISAYNLNFSEAMKEYNLGKKYSNSSKTLDSINKQKNIIANIRRFNKNELAHQKYWEQKNAIEKSKHNQNLMFIGLNTFNQTMNETNQIIANSNLTTMVASQSGYNTKRINQIQNNAIQTQQNKSVSNIEYNKRLNALTQMNKAYIERQALYKIKGNLMNLYNEEEKGKVFRNTIDSEISKAEKDYDIKKSSFDKLVSNQYHTDQVTSYVHQNPSTSDALNLGVRDYEIDKRFNKLKDKYKYFYIQDRNLYK